MESLVLVGLACDIVDSWLVLDLVVESFASVGLAGGVVGVGLDSLVT